MSGPTDIHPLRPQQRRASDPQASAWVAANAGSGKTFVLAARVLRLLLAGTPPDRLLCLTFTKAAAAEMKTRVFDALRRWAIAPDAELSARIDALTGRAPSATEQVRARRLFADALETPGGLKIQTIHSFGESILARFPFEANVPAEFTLLDEAGTNSLLADCRTAVLREALMKPGGDLGRALDVVTARVGEEQLDELVQEVLGKRGDLSTWIEDAGNLEAAIDRLGAALGIPAGETHATIDAEIVDSPHLPMSEWSAVADALMAGQKLDRDVADDIRNAVNASDAARPELWRTAFLTKGETPLARFPTKPIRTQEPHLAERLDAEKERLAALTERRKAIVMLEGSAALFRLSAGILDRYERIKRARGLIDYDDQIEKTRQLLTRSRGAAWVLYKLDNGIDHILVDEAQDTNPAQWEIVAALSDEFFAGDSARHATRTVFAVGDEKQSIFSFQGADPDIFDAMRRRYGRRTADADLAFHREPLTTSFRTAQPLLDAVDAVFSDDTVRAGVSADTVWPSHTSERRGAPGRVEMWPLVETTGAEPDDAWRQPVDAPAAQDAVRENARRIAAVIGGWIARGETVSPGGDPITAGDVLILVRKRGGTADALIRALRERNIPVAGADRISLAGHIAVSDCLALARFVLQPADDLNLAALLKSPFCGLDDDDLMALAPGREGTLWHAVETEPAYRATADRLRHWLSRADIIRPFEFFAEALGPGGARKAFHGRMGTEVDDVLDEFLAQVITFEQQETPSLQGLVHFIETSDVEIKRDMDQGRGEVRVMTVHGAKGLEAPIVILADGLTVASTKQVASILRLGPPGAPLVWRTNKAADVAPVATARDTAMEAGLAEARRLLYVALTRARDRLYIAGHKTGSREVKAENWYALVETALGAGLGTVSDPYGLGFDVRRFADFDRDEQATIASGSDDHEPPLPDWVFQTCPAEPAPPRILAPSGAWQAAAGAADRTVPEPPPPDPLASEPERNAAERGRLIHRLLEKLPDIDAADRPDIGGRFLAAHAAGWPADQRVRMLDEALAVLADPAVAALFAPGSRAELPVVGTVSIDDERVEVAGIIDRIAVTPEKVIVADFKTNFAPPGNLDDIPDAYVVQMAVYRALIGELFPGRTIETVLIWTAVPSIMRLPDAILSATGVAP